MARILVDLVNLIVWLICVVLFLDALSSFVLDPWHPARRFLDQLAEPFVRPFRNRLPLVGSFDFSVTAALIVVWIAGQILDNIIVTVFH
jgi:YggT family protein